MGTLRECASLGVWDEKMFASCFKACNFSLPILAKWVDGLGFKRAAINAAADSVAASEMEVLGMLKWGGKNWTISDIRSDTVLVM